MADWYFRNNTSNSLQVCPECRKLINPGQEFCPFCARRLRAEGGARGFLKQYFSRPDAMTRVILGMIVGVFILQFVVDYTIPVQYREKGSGLFSLFRNSSVTYVLMGSNLYEAVGKLHQYWRWVTCNFLHIGILHILFNSWAFWDLSRLAEKLWGPRQVFATFILTGIAGSALSYVGGVLFRDGIGNSAGASAAVCGILGLLLGAYRKNKYNVGEFLGTQLIRWAVYILAFGLMMNTGRGGGGGVDNAAHIGGFLAGGILGYFLVPTAHTKNYGRDRLIWNGLAGLALLLLLVSIGFAVYFYDSSF